MGANEAANGLTKTGPFSAWEIQEVLDAIGESQGADLIRTARKVGINDLVTAARAMKSAFEARRTSILPF